ncbi:hypothetical protein [Candidatus Lucifugimonas marina]|uniref:hypothetical protein n=1 Tax=Candidatus Lucifugimonas marina TaxID=3038979 RepID=UPI00319DBDE1
MKSSAKGSSAVAATETGVVFVSSPDEQATVASIDKPIPTDNTRFNRIDRHHLAIVPNELPYMFDARNTCKVAAVMVWTTSMP